MQRAVAIGIQNRAQSEAMRENQGRNKDKYSNLLTKKTSNQHFLLIRLNYFSLVVAGRSVRSNHRDEHQYSRHHIPSAVHF